jgi:hypothetical protein
VGIARIAPGPFLQLGPGARSLENRRPPHRLDSHCTGGAKTMSAPAKVSRGGAGGLPPQFEHLAKKGDLGIVRSGRRPDPGVDHPQIPVFLDRNRQDDAVRPENRVGRRGRQVPVRPPEPASSARDGRGHRPPAITMGVRFPSCSMCPARISPLRGGPERSAGPRGLGDAGHAYAPKFRTSASVERGFSLRPPDGAPFQPQKPAAGRIVCRPSGVRPRRSALQ